MNTFSLVTFIILSIISFSSCDNSLIESKIKMVLTGSVHGQLDPCGWRKNPLGGLSRKLVVLEEMRKNGDDPLILDAGDMFFSKTNINSSAIVSDVSELLKRYSEHNINDTAVNIDYCIHIKYILIM